MSKVMNESAMQRIEDLLADMNSDLTDAEFEEKKAQVFYWIDQL